MSWEKVKLGDILNIEIGRTPSRSQNKYWGKGYDWVSIRDLNNLDNGCFITNTKEQITELGVKDSKIKQVPPGTVLFSFKLSIGKIAITKEPLYTNEAIAALIIKEKVKLTSEFLFYAMSCINFDSHTDHAVMGKTLNKRKLNLLEIPLPDLQTQQQIVTVLDKAQAIIQKREQSLTLLDELLRSTFLDMFGDPVLNKKGWNIERLIKVVPKIDAGWSPVCENFSRKNNSDWAVLKQSAISKRIFKPEENKQLPKGIKIKKDVTANKGDLLFSRKNSTQFVGSSVFIYDEYQNLLLPDTIFNLRYDYKKVTGIYLNYLFNDRIFRLKVQNLKSGSASSMPNISQKKLLDFKIPLPPIELQTKFSTIVLKTRQSNIHVQRSLEEANTLFQSLLQEAFNGELTLKVDKVEIQSALNKINWFDDQLKQLTSNNSFDALKVNLGLFNALSEPFKQITKLQENLNRFKIPSLDKITQFKKNLERLNISELKQINSLQEFNILKNIDFLREEGDGKEFKIKSLEKLIKAEKDKELEEQLKQESDPILQFISENQIGKFTVEYYNINIARGIYNLFNSREFDLSSLIIALNSVEGVINVSRGKLKKDLFQIFKDFIMIRHYGVFSFNNMRQNMRQKLFNPSFDLLQEFIDTELDPNKKDGLSQKYNEDVHKDYKDPFYNGKSSIEQNRAWQIQERRVYLQYNLKEDED